MSKILPGLRKSNNAPYNVWKLVERKYLNPYKEANAKIQMICDIDKTYLETQFESLMKMAKIVLMENAQDKVTVSGAQEVLYALRWGNKEVTREEVFHQDFPRGLHFVSSSPPQLRATLEEKLHMDRLDWTSTTFKNQAYNIKQGRFDLLRQQMAYKTAAILEVISRPEVKEQHFLMLGDSAESDAYIYLGVKLFLAGKLSRDGYLKYLYIAGVDKDVAESVLSFRTEEDLSSDAGERSFAQLLGKEVDGVFIRLLHNYKLIDCPPLTDGIFYFDNYFQVALICGALGYLEEGSLWYLARHFHNTQGMDLYEIIRHLYLFSTRFEMPDHFRKEVEYVLGKANELVKDPQVIDEQSFPRFYPIKRKEYDDLTEEDIMTLARKWMSRVLSEND